MNIELAVEIAAALCRRWEGLRLSPYLCPAGVPTIGYGATYYPSGESVRLTDPPITRERAQEILLWMIRRKYMPAVTRLCRAINTPERLAAITDFAVNLGAGALQTSTLRKRINSGDWHDVPAQLRKWIHAGGRPLEGLRRRRAAEIALVRTGHT